MLGVLVNTSDGFADCWGPFFQLFERYGGSLRDRPVYLNTERSQFAWPGLDLRATRVWPEHEHVRPTWSECLIRALHQIEESYVLYMQEDYFLTREVDSAAISQSLADIDRDPTAGVVYLNRYGPLYTYSRPYNDRLLEIVPPCRYLVSTQCAIWRKEYLLSLVRAWENGWMFEIFASKRATHSQWKSLMVRPEVLTDHPIIDYIYTGVMKGQWKTECVPLFVRENIEVDFAGRGMYQERGRLKSKCEVARKLGASPGGLMRSLMSLVQR